VSDPKPARSIFALRLAQARARAGLSQAQLGVLAGLEPEVASPRINQYERSVHEPRSETARRLAEALGIPPAFLYTEDETLAKLLLAWIDLKPGQRRDLLKQAQAAVPAGKRKLGSKKDSSKPSESD
jgi:transcriptional regulator with XRE-family HTH domain